MKEEEINRIQNEMNTRSIPDFDNLSPMDMHELLYNPFSENSIIQYKKNISDALLDKIGFLQLVEYLLQELSEKGEIKLTKWNNLNTKLVTEIYRLNFPKEVVFQLRERKVYKQDELLSLQNAIIILNDILKFTKKRKGKMSLTKKGSDFIAKESRLKLLQSIFEAYAFNLNWSYHDGYEDTGQIQKTFGYILYLILQYGHEERVASFYANKLHRAFPQLTEVFTSAWLTPLGLMKSCMSTRCFQRFFNWFHFIEVQKDYLTSTPDNTLLKNHLISDILELDKTKFKFKKEKFSA